MKVIIVLEVKDQPRAREMVAMWAYGLVGQTEEVFSAMEPNNKVGEIEFRDFLSAEQVHEPPAQHRVTKRDLQEKLGVSGNRDE